MNGGFSIIVGDPRIGKTSLLKYISDSQNTENLYGDAVSELGFCYLNAQTFGDSFTGMHFWQRATAPLYKRFVEYDRILSLKYAYEKCKASKFSYYPSLENLFKKLDTIGWRLVLLIDEFDIILEHPKLNSKVFLGHLRTLLSNHTSLACIASARQSLTQLNNKTKGYADGSPYFNILVPITLVPFGEKDAAELFGWAGERFTVNDRRYLFKLTGGHPFLLQFAASELWESYIEMPNDVARRYQQLEGKLYEIVSSMFSDIWKVWSPEMRMAFTAIGLPDMSLGDVKFSKRNLLKDLQTSLNPEIQELKRRGLIVKDQRFDEKWHVRSLISLWWLADQILREVRDESSFRTWLQKQQIDHLLVTREQKKRWNEVLRSVGEMLKDGTQTLIEATAKGFGEAITKQP